MSSKIQTSTPIIYPKSGNNSSRNSWLNHDVTQQLYRNTWNKFKSPEKASSSWDAIDGPKFNDFDDGISEVRDSYFDRRHSDCPSPQRREEMVLPTPDEAEAEAIDIDIDIVDSFKSCAISVIVNSNTDIEDNTLIADETRDENDGFQPLETMQGSFNIDTSKSDRRLSIVQPFSFEIREQENQQRRESRRAYYKMLTDRMSPQPFKAKPAPKFTQRLTAINTPVNAHNNTSVNSTLTPNTNEVKLEIAPKRIIRVPRKTDASKFPERIEKPRAIVQAPKLMKFTANPPLPKAKSASVQSQQTTATASNPFSIQPKVKAASNPFSFHTKTKTTGNPLQSQQTVKNASNPFLLQAKAKNATNPFQWQKSKDSAANSNVAKTEKPNGNSGDVQNGGKFAVHSVQIKKQKPFQVTLPHRKIEIPKPPVLMTAQRARERQLFEEKIRERERQKEEIKKMELAAQKTRELEEIARLRKQTVFKARPVPHYKNVLPQVQKRPLTEPMMPIFIKRRRVR